MNKTAQYQLTIIVPIYNEEGNIPRLEHELATFLPTSLLPACVLLVNDGSTDDSPRLIHEACARQPHFYYLDLTPNGGLSAALKAGIDHAQSPWIGYIDADLQTAPADFNLLLPHVDRYQLILGIRAGRKDSFVKNLSSRVANAIRRSFTHDGITDTGCPLKVIRADHARRLPLFTGMHRFLPALVQLQHGAVLQVPVRHFPRVAGKSKYNLANRLIGPLKDCFAYRWMRKRYINYTVTSNNL